MTTPTCPRCGQSLDSLRADIRRGIHGIDAPRTLIPQPDVVGVASDMCPFCVGCGFTDKYGKRPCDFCHATGKNTSVYPTTAPLDASAAPVCAACNDTGEGPSDTKCIACPHPAPTLDLAEHIGIIQEALRHLKACTSYQADETRCNKADAVLATLATHDCEAE